MSRTHLLGLCTTFALSLSACGGDSPPGSQDMAGVQDLSASSADLTTNTNNGPKIISLGANVTQITIGESVRMVAVVTDPSGLQNLVGGQLVSPDGSIKYGAFIAAQQGSYNLDLSWSQINQAQPINFAMEDKRTFVAEFYNVLGQKSSQAVMLRLHCTTAAGVVRGACAGVCGDEGATCGGGGGRICVAGACAAGCYINNMLLKPDTARPGNVCQTCQPAVNTSSYSSVPADTTCGSGVYCRSGNCVVRFQSRLGGAGAGFLNGPVEGCAQSASNVFVINDRGGINRTTDGGMAWSTPYNPPAFSESWNSIWAASATEVFAVGPSARSLRTTNGTVWSPATVPGIGTSSLNGVWGSAANDVYAVGTAGTIARWNGAAWTKQQNASADHLNAVWGAGAAVFAVGAGGTVLKTTNQGTTWSRLTTNVATTLSGIYGFSATDVWAVGSSATVLHTTDGGTTWTKVPFTDASSLYSVWGTGNDNLFIGTSNGVYRTTDSGATWLLQGGAQITTYSLFGTGAADVWALSGSAVYHNY